MRTPDFLTSFTDPAPYAGSSQPAARVRVVPYRGRFLVSALAAEPSRRPPFEPFPLPPLPGEEFDRMSRLLRCVWRRSLRAAGWLLYLDPLRERWHCAPSPHSYELVRQVTSAEAPVTSQGQAEEHEPRRGPHDHLLLGGVYTVSPATDPRLLARQLPACDGLSVFWHPGGWTHATVLLTALGQVWRLPVLDAVRDSAGVSPADGAEALPAEADPYERPWIAWDGDGR